MKVHQVNNPLLPKDDQKGLTTPNPLLDKEGKLAPNF